MNKNPAYHIRPMTEADLPAVCQIEQTNFSSPWTEGGFRDALTQTETEYLVCEVLGEIAGYCGAYISCGEADIVNVSVDRRFQNRQIATGLLLRLIARLRERAVTAMTLEVRKSNLSAIHLYEKLGFQSEGIRPGFYDSPKEDAVIMWLR